ncbi:MAG TPA: serine hydrolase domain-containing protein, partial [Gemmatimonadales bacterium]|nr:serine hydrolase domain-containing protein [Gemmatimonadales bacterium]
HRARGYAWRDSAFVNAFEFLALRPSGAFLSTVLDLARWDAALYQDLPLTEASRREMWTPYELTTSERSRYGFGWQLDTLDGHWNVHHGGALPGFRAEMSRFPNDSLTVIVLTNGDGARPDRLAAAIAKLYFGRVIR